MHISLNIQALASAWRLEKGGERVNRYGPLQEQTHSMATLYGVGGNLEWVSPPTPWISPHLYTVFLVLEISDAWQGTESLLPESFCSPPML